MANATKASPEQLKAHAQDAGLNVAPFEQCFSSGKYQFAVQKDIEGGTRAGITGTPGFFITGKWRAYGRGHGNGIEGVTEERQIVCRP